MFYVVVITCTRPSGLLTSTGNNLVSTYPLVVQSWGDLDSTCGSLGRSHHRTAAGPTETQHHVQFVFLSTLTHTQQKKAVIKVSRAMLIC